MLIDRKTIAGKFAVSQRVLRETIEVIPSYPKPAIYVNNKTVRWREDEIDAFIERGYRKAAQSSRLAISAAVAL